MWVDVDLPGFAPDCAYTTNPHCTSVNAASTNLGFSFNLGPTQVSLCSVNRALFSGHAVCKLVLALIRFVKRSFNHQTY